MSVFIRKLAIAAAALGAGAMLAAPALAAQQPVAITKGEAKLAKMLEGRVAGEPESCITTFGSRPIKVIDGTALVYERGDTLWVNVPHHPDSLDAGDILIIRRHGSQLCRTDLITTADRSFGMYTGNIFLGDFVPYRKAGD